jgi:hypothetical protein
LYSAFISSAVTFDFSKKGQLPILEDPLKVAYGTAFGTFGNLLGETPNLFRSGLSKRANSFLSFSAEMYGNAASGSLTKAQGVFYPTPAEQQEKRNNSNGN